MRIKRNVSVTVRSAELGGRLIFSISTSSPYSLYTRFEPLFASDALFFRALCEVLRRGATGVEFDGLEPPGELTVLVTMITAQDSVDAAAPLHVRITPELSRLRDTVIVPACAVSGDKRQRQREKRKKLRMNSIMPT